MHASRRTRLRLILGGLLVFLAISTFPGRVAAGEGIRFLSPGDGMETGERKPAIRFSLDTPVELPALLVLLDGTDITHALDLAPDGFSFRPVQPLTAGEHRLDIYLQPAGAALQTEAFRFTVRNDGYFDDFTSSHEATLAYEQLLQKTASLVDQPYHSAYANLGSITDLKKGPWSFGIATTLRYLDRSVPVLAPEEKGLDLIDYRLSALYSGDPYSLLAETGDLLISETPYTVIGLARRGARVALTSDRFTLQGFVVQSEQPYGLDGGSGIEFDSRDHIYGIAGELALLAERLTVRTIYLKGGEKTDSFGLYSPGGPRQGHVLGLIAKSRLYDGKLALEGEYDTAKYDGDTDDEFDAEQDHAWNLKLSGSSGGLSGQASYEYVGTDYEVIGNQGLPRDREGGTLFGGWQLDAQAINVTLSRYEDNLQEDNLFPQVVSWLAAVDYSCFKFASLPVGLNLQRSVLDTSMVPEAGFPIETVTDTLAARLNYLKESWNIGLFATLSRQDDQTGTDYDTHSQAYTLAPVYSRDRFAFAPNLTFNRATDETAKVDTDTYLASLDLRGSFAEAISYELAGTFSRTKRSDHALEFDSLASQARISYHFLRNRDGWFSPVIGLRGLYNRTEDRIYDLDHDEFALLLAFSASLGLSL